MRTTIESIPLRIVGVMALLEALTVPLVVILPRLCRGGLKNPVHGIVIGFAGVLVLFCLLNRFLKRLDLRLETGTVERVSPPQCALWGAVVLSLIFAIQAGAARMTAIGYPVREVITGFVSTGGSILLSASLYRFLVRMTPLPAIRIRSGEKDFLLADLSVGAFALLGGIYEAFALPVILVWRYFPEQPVTVSLISGPVGGAVGALAALCLYNLASGTRCWFECIEYRPRHRG